jgi:predicted amino acid-binding ACT domain protein
VFLLNHKEQPQYFPKNLPIARSKGDNIVEFAIFGRDEIGGFADITQVFSKHKINIKDITSNEVEDVKSRAFCTVAGFFCDFTTANCTIEQIEFELRAIHSVVDVQTYNMKDKIWDRFFFPTNLNGSRVIMLRVGPLLRIERNLIERLGTAGAAIMFHEGEVYAEETFHEYKKLLPNASTERYLQCVVDGLRATGWGIVEFRKLSFGFEVRIKDPPILIDLDYKENRFLYGAASRIVELLFDTKLFLAKSTFDENTSVLTLKFSLKQTESVQFVSTSSV